MAVRTEHRSVRAWVPLPPAACGCVCPCFHGCGSLAAPVSPMGEWAWGGRVPVQWCPLDARKGRAPVWS